MFLTQASDGWHLRGWDDRFGACSVRSARIGYSLDGFCRFISQRQPLLDIFTSFEQAELPESICRSLRMIYCNSTAQVKLARKEQETDLHGQRRQARLSGERLLLCTGFLTTFFDGSRTRSFRFFFCCARLSSSFSVCLCWWFCGGCFILPITDDRPVSGLKYCGWGDWTQLQSQEVLCGCSLAATVATS